MEEDAATADTPFPLSPLPTLLFPLPTLLPPLVVISATRSSLPVKNVRMRADREGSRVACRRNAPIARRRISIPLLVWGASSS